MNKELAIVEGAKLLKAIGNERRLDILYYLLEGEKRVGVLEELLKISQSALSQHLAILREANIVKTRREAQTIYYAIDNKKVSKLLVFLNNLYAKIY